MPFARHRKSGRDALVLAREHRPGAAEAGRDLVEDQVDVVAAGTARRRLREEARRVHEHAGGALDQRLDDERGDLVGASLELVRDPRERGAAVGAGGRRDRNRSARAAGRTRVEQIDAADADRAERVAVIGLGQRAGTAASAGGR